jgi:hypothetical protein
VASTVEGGREGRIVAVMAPLSVETRLKRQPSWEVRSGGRYRPCKPLRSSNQPTGTASDGVPLKTCTAILDVETFARPISWRWLEPSPVLGVPPYFVLHPCAPFDLFSDFDNHCMLEAESDPPHASGVR